MHIRNSNLRILVSCLMLFIFMVKLTATGGIFKFQKINILITNDSEGRLGDEKKNEGKPSSNFNEFLSFPPASIISYLAYFTIRNPHPEFLVNFFSTHYPAVLTPPPNC